MKNSQILKWYEKQIKRGLSEKKIIAKLNKQIERKKK